MRILFLTHYYPPEGNAPANRVHALCRRWARDGHDVTVVTCAPNVPSGVVYDGYRNRIRQRETIDGVRVVRVWTYLAPNEGTVRRIANYLSFMASGALAAAAEARPDVVVATSPQFFCGWAGAIVSRIRRVPFALEIRDLWPESIVTVGAMRKSALVRLLERLERRLYASASEIVTVGEGYRDRLLERGVDPTRLSVIPNGVDREVFAPRPPDRALRERLGFGDRFACAYVGTVGMAAGLDVVLRAGRLLAERGRQDVVLAVVGDGAERRALAERAAREGIPNVVFTGRLPADVMPALLASVDACLVHLRAAELFTTVLPSKIFEAAAMSRPIVLGVRGHAERLVRAAGCGLCIAPEDASALADAVVRLADDPALAAELGEAGRQYFTARYDRDALARRYVEMLARLARRPSTVAPAPEGPAARGTIAARRAS
ncbi:MAG TPA: glycosyltransferase family 4 protein [Burkholderiales bacterium]|nr:glycosyltransferase family 4 protein [Burkholderiales bacterium]